jgi:hypothetical protein
VGNYEEGIESYPSLPGLVKKDLSRVKAFKSPIKLLGMIRERHRRVVQSFQKN